MSIRYVIAEPCGRGWRGRHVHDDGEPDHAGTTFYDAVVGHFGRDVHAARDYFLHDHTSWSHLGGDFTQPTGFVEAVPDAAVTAAERARHQRRNQCYCHGDRHEPGGWIYDFDPNPAYLHEYAYVLGDTTLQVQVPGNRSGLWWPAAHVPWTQPPPDWHNLHHTGPRP